MSVIKGVWIRVKDRIVLVHSLRAKNFCWDVDNDDYLHAIFANDSILGYARNKKDAHQILDEFGRAITDGHHFLRIYGEGEERDYPLLEVAKIQIDCHGILGDTLELLEEA